MENTQVTGRLVPQAATSTLEVQVSKELLFKGFDDYWASVKDRLNPELVKKAMKGGYREVKRDKVVKVAGGASVFYRPVLVQLVSEYMASQPKQALAYEAINLIEGIEVATIQAAVYMEPEVTWKVTPVPGVESPFEIQLPKLADNLLEQVVDAELKRAQDGNVVLVPLDSELTVERGTVAALDCQTVLDGQPWEPGTFTNNKWLIDDAIFKIPGMVDQIVGMTAGGSKTFKSTFNEKFGELAGKEAEITIRVNQIFKKEVPAIDDDLAITMGKDSLEAWKKELTTQYTEMLAQERANYISQSIVSKLINPEVVEVGAIPYVWMINKAQQIYVDHRNMVRTEEDLLQRFAQARTVNGEFVKTKEDLLAFFAQKAGQMLVTDLVYRSLGKLKGVEGNSALTNLSAYSEAVRQVLVKEAKTVEVEPNAAV